MYLSLPQIVTSLGRLGNVHPFFGFAFFGFKKARIPIDETKALSYTFLQNEIMDAYFRPYPGFDRYFNPFKTTSRWVSERYVSTSLQRVIADTFADAFIHRKKSSEWGWKSDYVSRLKRLMNKFQSAPIPAVDIAVWFYRKTDFTSPDVKAELVDRLIEDFFLTENELVALFDTLTSGRTIETSDRPASDVELLNAIGWPEGSEERAGVTLKQLELFNVGPTRDLKYVPSSRLNLITGDNSLGKSFLLDCAWWAITGEWATFAAEPSNETKGPIEIRYTLASRNGRAEDFVAPFSRLEESWQRPQSPFNGLALFSTFDGHVALWDPIRADTSLSARKLSPQVLFSKDEIWNGLTAGSERQKRSFVSNGLIRDCISWQTSKRHHEIFEAFKDCLSELSPPDGAPIRFGNATRIQNDSRDIPTIVMPYGSVPIVFASAGIQRILGLSYMLTWSWFEHLGNSRRVGKEPLRHITVLLDEIEAHLHPKWQRQILPAIVKTLQRLSSNAEYQIHVASHSPLVLASIEPIFNRSSDSIHQLSLSGRSVSISMVDFVKHGSVDAWLESDVFGLADARSMPSERAIVEAKALQLTKSPSATEVEAVNRRLRGLLPDDDPFWVRWNYFYETHSKRESSDD